MNRNTLFLVALLWTITLLNGCGNHAPFEAHLSEGVIEYEVTYPELDSNNIMLEMLPNKMVMTFKEDKYKSELKAAAGVIEMAVLADAKKEKMYNLVKIFSDRYSLELDKTAALAMTNTLPPFQTQFLGEVDKIADANCEKVLIDFGTANSESYIFCYTEEINLKTPNWCTPYHQINGVLLDYVIENYGMTMHLKAIRIIPQEIEDSFFEISDDYEPLSPAEFDALVVKNMEIFME